MIELAPPQFEKAHPLFACTRYGALAAATLHGAHPGRVFVDDPQQPAAGLVCTRAGIGYYFLAGQPAPAFLNALHTAFQADFLPAQHSALNNPEVLLFYDSPAWQGPLFTRFADCRPVRIQKKRFRLPLKAGPLLAAQPPVLPEGLRALPYNRQLLMQHPSLSEEVLLFYGSIDAFLEKSLGVCILAGDAPASFCHAVFTGGGEAEISIATTPDYRRQGLAYQAAQAFIAECCRRQLTPIWGCWPENAPSVALAEKLGFREDANQPVCLWIDRPDWNR